jgi:dUTPase
VRPGVELTDNLVKLQVGLNDGAHNLVWRHARHSDVSRIAQAVLAPVTRGVWREVTELPESARGAGGFGSTGTKA